MRKRGSCAGGSRSWLSVWPGSEERLSRLVITRETVEEVVNGSGAEAARADGDC